MPSLIAPRAVLFRIALCLVLGLGLTGLAARTAAETAAPVTLNVRTGIHPDFDRIVFDNAHGMKHTLQNKGAHITIAFADPVTVSVKPLENSKLTRARHFALSGDRSLTFDVAAGARISSFLSGTSIVIDISGATAPDKPREKPAEAPPKEPAKPVEKEKPASAPTAAPHDDAKPPEDAKAPPPAPAAPSPAPAPATGAVPATATPPVALTPPPPATTQPATVTQPATGKAVPPVLSAPNPIFSAPPAADIPDVGYAPELVASFDPKIASGAVIFARGDYGTILFDRKISMDAAALTAGTPLKVKLEPLDFPNNSGFRFPIPSDADIRATRVGTAWQIYLGKQPAEVIVSPQIVAQPDFALGARLLLPLDQAPDPVRITDPSVGDTLIVVPLRDTAAFGAAYRMADIVILPAAQGLVIRPLHDKVVARAVPDGIEVTAEGGLRLSPSSDSGASDRTAQIAKPGDTSKFIFDFQAWKGKPGETFTDARQRIDQTIVDVPLAVKNRARLDLARLYFSHGMGEEAVAILGQLAKKVPDLANHSEFLALRGGANIIAYRPQEGLADLDTPELKFQPEIELWQAVALAQLRDWKSAEEKFNIAENIMLKYPEPFFSRFMVLAIESALATGRDREAAEWLDKIETGSHSERAVAAMKYLRAVLHSHAGRAEVAESLWREVTHSPDRLYKIRAELALIDLGVATKSLTPAQAAERLEGLRFAWRGDDLEVDILHRLGGFYLAALNSKAGLAALNEALRLYPDSPLAPQIRDEMQASFRSIFIDEAAIGMTPLEALAIYQDYKNLMPSGAEGITIGQTLAERLVSIDLLDQAAAILNDQIKNSLQGEAKARTGARLAAVRLLDKKPEAALLALDDSVVEPMPEALTEERTLLHARAFSDQGKPDDALNLIKDLTSLNARKLKANITLRAGRWADAAKALLDLVGPPPKPGDVISPDQAGWLVSTAIALSMAGDTTQLDQLAIDYTASMAGTSEADTFRVLTHPDKSGQLKDIASAQAKLTEVDLFRGFLNGYRAGTTAKPAAKPQK